MRMKSVLISLKSKIILEKTKLLSKEKKDNMNIMIFGKIKNITMRLIKINNFQQPSQLGIAVNPHSNKRI